MGRRLGATTNLTAVAGVAPKPPGTLGTSLGLVAVGTPRAEIDWGAAESSAAITTSSASTATRNHRRRGLDGCL